MRDRPNECRVNGLPPCALEFIARVTKRIRYRRKVRQDVQAELAAHFEDELRDCAGADEREQRAQRLIEEFGDPKLLAVLCRRAKKRCRPLHVKILIQGLKAMGICFLLLSSYVVWFVNGKPIIKVDYLVVLNQMSCPEAAEQEDAWPYYERAMASFTAPNREPIKIPFYRHPEFAEPPVLDRLPEDTQRAIADWIEGNHDAWELFVLAGTKRYCLKSYEYFREECEPWLISAGLREPPWELSRMGICLSRLRVMQGRTGDALEACLAVARAGRHWQQSGASTEQLMGITLSCRAHDEILTILGHQRLSEAELTHLQRELAALYPPSYPLLGLEEQRLVFADVVQHLFTEGGPGGGHLIPAKTAQVMTMITDELGARVHAPTLDWRVLSFLHAGRDETLAKAREIFDLQDKLVRMSPYARHVLGGTRADIVFESHPQVKYALVQILAPVPDREVDLTFQAKALHEATLAVVALLRHRQERGSYPATLEELKRVSYLDTLPADPYGKALLAYKVTGAGFTLYSVGPDFLDDNGKSVIDAKGHSTMWADDGDTVFWPVGP